MSQVKYIKNFENYSYSLYKNNKIFKSLIIVNTPIFYHKQIYYL